MIYCTHCATPRESGSPFCTGCGQQFNAALQAPTIAMPHHSSAIGQTTHPRRRFALVLAALVLLLGGGGVAAWAVLTQRADPPAPPGSSPSQPQATTASSAQSDPPRNDQVPPGSVAASALCVSPDGQDGGGTTVTYGPEKAVDGLLNTAWRCNGDGVGQRLEISLPGRVTLTSIGLVPGYSKTDPSDGTDRYAQNRRISTVQYTFDDGTTVPHSFDTSSSYRSIQTVALPNVSTSHVTITILSSVSGEATGGQQLSDKVAISEVTFSVQ
ncbi:MAG: discoidin domain-containing protein [Pseudonocardiaceae bacterium]